MIPPTQYVATLRCQTWNVWPEKTIIEAESFCLDLGIGDLVPAQIAVLSYLNRTKPEEYTAERTEVGSLVWRGNIPGQYLVRDATLKAPEDVVTIEWEHEHTRRGEIDIAIAFSFSGQIESTIHEAIRCTAFAFMSLINLRLSDYLTPVAPLKIRKILDTGSQFESVSILAVRKRESLHHAELQPTITHIARVLSFAPKAEKLRTALELYGSHFYERQARTRFLLLVIALEALAPPTDKLQVALDLLAK